MALFSIANVAIKGVAACVPSQQKDNLQIKNIAKEELEAIVKNTGIRYRRIAQQDQTAADLCYTAAKRLLDELGWAPSEIDALVFVTQTPDYPVPGNSMLLQDRLGLSNNCLAFDINQGCAGYVYGLSSIAALLAASGLKKALLLVGDTITRFIAEDDNSLIPIFSDAGTATALAFDEGAETMHFNLQTDGESFKNIYVDGNGARTNEANTSGKANLKMNGHEVFVFGLQRVAKNIKALMAENESSPEQYDKLVLHQANQLLLEAIARKAGFTHEQLALSLKNFGNTSCATIPITLVDQLSSKLESSKMRLILAGFGVGLSWGSAAITTSNIKCPPMLEL